MIPMKPMLRALILILAVAASARADENRGAQVSEQKKPTVAEVLKALQLDETKLRHSDEPPGKLRALEGEVTLRDTRLKVNVRIDLVYTTAVFSTERKWDPKAVRAAAVQKVTITPLD